MNSTAVSLRTGTDARDPACARWTDLDLNEENRFQLHQASRAESALARLSGVLGVRHASIVELDTGLPLQTTGAAGPARYATYLPALLHRAECCCKLLPAAANENELEMLCISTRSGSEILVCSDPASSGCAVLVEQDRFARPLPTVATQVEQEAAYCRLLLASGDAIRPGAFATSDAFNESDLPTAGKGAT